MEEDYLPNKKNDGGLDWKHQTKGWQYSSDAPHNRQWKKDRAELFKKNGNGWWWTYGVKSWRKYLDNAKKKKN